MTPGDGPAVVLVRGDLTLRDSIEFMRKTENVEQATVFLQSSGGDVAAGLSIGKTIRSRGFATAVPPSVQCISACALAWLGGTERFMAENARIGFHEAYIMMGGRPYKSQEAEAMVLDYLHQLQLPQPAIDYITGSPPQGLYVLTRIQAQRLGVEVGPYEAGEITASTDATRAPAPAPITRLPQVDLYGRNLPDMPVEAANADQCQALCTANEGCTAFTFNTARSACFLKASAEIAITHPAAVSGYRNGSEKDLRHADLTVQEATDYPGNDIEHESATSFDACLISCSEESSCKAFTYVISRHECWLKNAIGSAEPRDGLVSGIK
jgi:hypothetical protein